MESYSLLEFLVSVVWMSALCFCPQGAQFNLHCAYPALASTLRFGFLPHCCFWLNWTFPLFNSMGYFGEKLSLYHLRITNTPPLVFFLPTFQEISQLLPGLFSWRYPGMLSELYFPRALPRSLIAVFDPFHCVSMYVCVWHRIYI